MGNAFVAGLKNEAPRGSAMTTNEDRNSEVSHRGAQRGAEGSELSHSCNYTLAAVGIRRYRPRTPLRSG